MKLLHDWVLHSVELSWDTGEAVLAVSGEIGKAGRILCRGVTHLEIPRTFPWGPGVSILDCVGPVPKDGFVELAIEMQSGDVILIRAKEIILPET